MSRKLVAQILQECVDHQLRANLGGIVGGEGEQKMAEADLARYIKARDWYNKNN